LPFFIYCVHVKKTNRNLERNLQELKDRRCKGFYKLDSLVGRDIIILGSGNVGEYEGTKLY
jgi:hypothetical protein